MLVLFVFFFFSSRRRHTRYIGDWSSDVCSSDLPQYAAASLWEGFHLPARGRQPGNFRRATRRSLVAAPFRPPSPAAPKREREACLHSPSGAYRTALRAATGRRHPPLPQAACRDSVSVRAANREGLPLLRQTVRSRGSRAS